MNLEKIIIISASLLVFCEVGAITPLYAQQKPKQEISEGTLIYTVVDWNTKDQGRKLSDGTTWESPSRTHQLIHELGHYYVAKALGYEAEISYEPKLIASNVAQSFVTRIIDFEENLKKKGNEKALDELLTFGIAGSVAEELRGMKTVGGYGDLLLMYEHLRLLRESQGLQPINPVFTWMVPFSYYQKNYEQALNILNKLGGKTFLEQEAKKLLMLIENK